MSLLYIITDYKGHFGSKWKSKPYRSGYDKEKLKGYFLTHGIEVKFIKPIEIDYNSTFWTGKNVLLNSSEEPQLFYKQFLEDIAFALNQFGANLIPSIEHLQCHENKIKGMVSQSINQHADIHQLKYILLGNYFEFLEYLEKTNPQYPCIVKLPSGSKSSGVFLANNESELKNIVKKVSSNFSIYSYFKEFIRKYKHTGYIANSKYPKKLLIQEYVPNLSCDWKLLIYGSSIFILKRSIKKNDFRASGSGHKYTVGSQSEFPIKYLEALYQTFINYDTPNLSIDFGFDGEKAYIFETQAIYFGTSTQFLSKDYYHRKNGNWELLPNNMDQEEIFTKSIVEYLKRKK